MALTRYEKWGFRLSQYPGSGAEGSSDEKFTKKLLKQFTAAFIF